MTDPKKPVRFQQVTVIPIKSGYIVFALDYDGNLWQQETQLSALDSTRTSEGEVICFCPTPRCTIVSKIRSNNKKYLTRK